MNFFRKSLITPENLIRFEFFSVAIYWYVFSYFISFSDLIVNTTYVYGLTGISFLVYFLSYFFLLSRKTLRNVGYVLYKLSLFLLVAIAFDNNYNVTSFFILMSGYGLYCLLIYNLRTFAYTTTFVSSIILISIALLKFEIETPLYIIALSFSFVTAIGLLATIGRSFQRKRIKDRENLLREIFNQSSDGLILIDNQKNKAINANNRALKILAISELEVLMKLKAEDISIDGQSVLHQLVAGEQKILELSDNHLLTIAKKEIMHGKKAYDMLEIKEYKSWHELSLDEEFQKLKIITKESYESLFNTSVSLMCVIDENDRIIDINRTFLEFVGYDSEDLIGKKYNCLDYKNYGKERELINHKAWTGETQLFEKEIVSKDGLVISLEVILRKAKYFGKDVLISNSRDISQRKLLKKIADYNYLQYLNLFRASPISLVISDLDGDIFEINKSFEKLLGYEKEEILGRNIKMFSNEEDMQVNLVLREKLVKGEIDSIEMQKRYITKSGETVNTLLKIVIQKDENNEPSKFLAQIVDVSEFVKAEEKIKESEKSYRDVFNNSFELLYILNRENCFLDINKAVLDEYGFSKSEIVGKTPILFSAEGRNDMKQVFRQISQAWEGVDQQLLWWSKRKDGSIFPKDLHLRKGIYFGQEVLMCSGRNISDEFAYEQQLIKSEKKYKDLINKSIFGILIFNDNYVVFANDKSVDLLKYNSSENLIGKHRDDIIQIQNIKSFESNIKQVEEGKQINLEEYQFITSEGLTISVESSLTNIEFEGGNCLLNSFVDVSYRKEAESAQQKIMEAKSVNKTLKLQLEQNRLIQRRLQNSQSYSEGIIESSLDMIFTTDIKGKITKLNSAAKRELQLAEEEFIKKPFEILLADKKKGEEILEELNQKNAFSGEIEMQRNNGTSFPAFLSISYLFNTDGTFLGIMGVSRDITEIIAKEQEIKDQASKLTSIIESSSHLFFTVNKNYRITALNQLFIEDIKIKYGQEIELYDDFFKLYEKHPHEEAARIKESWIKKFDTAFKGKSIKFEVARKSFEGENFYREIYLNPIYSEKGTIEEVSAIGHDTTQKRLYELELQNSLNEKEILLKEVHHRVKNNMQVISSILNLQSAYVKDQSILAVLRESQNRIRAMASIHERLYRTKNFSDIKFSAYVKNLAESIVHTYELSKTSIYLSFSLDEVFLTLNTAIPCGLIINELISNSLKYAFTDKEKGKIKIKLQQEEGNVRLMISDDGIGIPESVDLNSTDTLGLQLVSTLVEQIDGQIKLKREKGTAFTITFNSNLEA